MVFLCSLWRDDTKDPWRNGSASDSRSEGCVFDSRRVQTPGPNGSCFMLNFPVIPLISAVHSPISTVHIPLVKTRLPYPAIPFAPPRRPNRPYQTPRRELLPSPPGAASCATTAQSNARLSPTLPSIQPDARVLEHIETMAAAPPAVPEPRRGRRHRHRRRAPCSAGGQEQAAGRGRRGGGGGGRGG